MSGPSLPSPRGRAASSRAPNGVPLTAQVASQALRGAPNASPIPAMAPGCAAADSAASTDAASTDAASAEEGWADEGWPDDGCADDGWVYAPPQEPLRIVHADRDLVAIDKPSGLLSVPGRSPAHADSALLRVQKHWPTAVAVHRLDLDTSGLLVFGLRGKAVRALMAQLRDRVVQKRYLAWVAGSPVDDQGIIDLPLRRVHGAPRSVIDATGRPSRTQWRVLQRGARASLLELRPVTGRSHQLRVHLCATGHPILGDRFYAPPAAVDAADRLLLHAAELQLRHPWSGGTLELSAPPDAHFQPR